MSYKRCEGGSKSFEPLNISESGYQDGALRYPISDSRQQLSVAPYRNNLVAFSQYHNLCFVASHARILIHLPIYLDHTLRRPRSVLEVATSNDAGLGYIDPGNSHSINHLVVAELGVEEVIVVVCDDGDVVTYEVRRIREELDQRGLEYTTPCYASNIQPIFLRNVGMSAWGVAVHKEARMIAVSSNSTRIHIFAFALGDTSCNSDTSDESTPEVDADLLSSLEDADWVRPDTTEQLKPFDRSRNLEVILTLHATNIPNVAFYNPYHPCTEDVFLVSTDIHGTTYVWDVWQQRQVADLTATSSHYRGWGVFCLDPFFSRPVEHTSELFGIEYHKMKRGPVILTKDGMQSVRGYDPQHFTLRERHETQDTPESSMSYYPTQASEWTSDESLAEDEEEEFHHDRHESLSEREVDLNGEISRNHSSVALATANLHQSISLKTVPDLGDGTRSAANFLPFNVLCTDELNVRLCHSIQHRRAIRPSRFEEIIYPSVLKQSLHPQDGHLKRLQRLNMVLQVPELGVVIVGDQMGRVALLTVTHRRRESKTRAEDGDGLRIEAFLPFKSQEDAGLRPKTELLGVAVGPVQGHERNRADVLGEDDGSFGTRTTARSFMRCRPYRLMLYYRDHTVLSYEIKR
ncbi:MAG: hypothetical protein Q9182_005347 [Xanthomendoza sp. 2 TL-2023]